LEALPATDEPVRQRAYDDDAEYGTGVIHVIAGDGTHGREGHPDEDEAEIGEREEVDWNAPAAKTVRAVSQWRTADFAQRDEKDWDDVGDVQAQGRERDDGVVGGGGADVY